MDSKENIRNNILIHMQNHVNAQTLQILDSILIKELTYVEITRLETMPSTELDNNEYIIKMYIARKGVKLSKKTLKQYLRSIKNLITVIDKSLLQITDIDIEYYLQKYAKGCSAVTINNERRNISAFYTWMRKSRLLMENPVDNVEVRKEINKPIDYLEGCEIEKLRGGCADLRDRALLEFLRSTGVRIGEIPLINRNDINWNTGDITILSNKTSQYRIVFMDASARYHVKNYTETITDDSCALFATQRKPHGAVQIEGLRKILKNIATRAEIHRRVYPHLMRKTLATTMNQRNCPVNMIQQILGHKNPSVTIKYYAATSTEQLRQAHSQFGAA